MQTKLAAFSALFQVLVPTLGKTLARDILVVGIDPLWDEAILQVIPEGTGAMWFVNEEDLTKHPLISRISQGRSTQHIIGREGSYEHFIKELYGNLNESIPTHYQSSVDNQLRVLQGQLRALQEENERSSPNSKWTPVKEAALHLLLAISTLFHLRLQ